ncbi:MAG: glucose-6-phosphate dehydrogenase, partial [Proteobacteria bacterium]|nr:glucose-6-phosphate dehydrogenase [Pseudomonadota bacterium]
MKATYPPFDMVLFGGTGDLVIRKLLPALYHLHRSDKLPDGRIVCLGRSQPDTATYLEKIRPLVEEYLDSFFIQKTWDAFARRIDFLQLDVENSADFQKLGKLLDKHPNRSRVFYLSTSPDLFAGVCQRLAAVKLNQGNS